jgi:transcriptional regulator with XRE-family HTH domain
MDCFSLGERLMIYRKRAGLSKKELAQKAMISLTALSQYENDTAMPDTNTANHIASVLGITASTLSGGFNQPNKEKQ